MSLEAMQWARPLVLPTTQKVVLFLLADMADARGEARPSQALIGRWTGLSERAVRRSIAALRDAGLLEDAGTFGRQQSLIYRVLVGAVPRVERPVSPIANPVDRTVGPGLAGRNPSKNAVLREVDRTVGPGLASADRTVGPGLARRQSALLLPLNAVGRPGSPVEGALPAAGDRTDRPTEASPSISQEGSSIGGRVARRAPRVASGTRLPDGWSPDAAGVEFARSVGVPLQRTLEDFRDYWAAAPGADGLKADWPATWRRWCRVEQQKLGRAGSRGARAQTLAQKQAESMERWFRRDADGGAQDVPDHGGPVIDMAANGDWR
jgi:hypothetical protein